MSMYSFSRLINKYSGPVVLHVMGLGAWVNGKWVEGVPTTQIQQAALIPFDVRTIAQLGGLVNTADVQIYSLLPFKHGDKIEKDDHKYIVDTSANFKPFGDFYRYVAKGVSSFD